MDANGPIPQAALTELLDWVDVKFNEDGTVRIIHMPSFKELMRAVGIVCKNIPHSIDEIHDQVLAEVWRVIPIWRYETLYPKVPRSAPVSFSAPPALTGTAYWEARIKGMKGAELQVLCAGNGIEVNMEAPNPGVLTMRLKNACYVALRRGKVFH